MFKYISCVAITLASVQAVDLSSKASTKHINWHKLAQSFSQELPPADEIMKMLDTSGNGTISWPEFKAFIHSQAEADGITLT